MSIWNTKRTGKITELEIYNQDKTASWNCARSAKQEINFCAYENLLTINSSEIADPDPDNENSRFVTKETFVDLSGDQVIALRDYLNEHFGDRK
mgnify:CR=1 FL=1|tara:strand:+ start:486 stop:767 length:282 start_codon:yes stop_codon:yes gene_type:complete